MEAAIAEYVSVPEEATCVVKVELLPPPCLLHEESVQHQEPWLLCSVYCPSGRSMYKIFSARERPFQDYGSEVFYLYGNVCMHDKNILRSVALQ